MSKQGLNIAEVRSLLQKMVGEGVAEGMHGGLGGDARFVLRPVEDLLHAARRSGATINTFEQLHLFQGRLTLRVHP